ncbi:MAG: M23 family metallopeptidase [Candidatus Choladocola sp.]|nr:M23 family metallopeptidase [Candidatus Choladocola sp.]
MDKRAWKEFFTRRSTIWTASLCLTGILVLGGIAAVDSTRRSEEQQTETEAGQLAYLEEEIDDTALEPLDEEGPQTEDAAQASGGAVADTGTTEENLTMDENSPGEAVDTAGAVTAGEEGTTEAGEAEAAEAASAGVISEQTLLQEGISFGEEDSLLWPSAGTIVIDYSMDGSIYFPTLNQYKYNPALIIGSDVGNQVLASARGIVESIDIDEETGTTLVLNIGNGYRLTYGQLKELAVTEGDVVESGTLLGYISEPTKYYSKEGSNLYFKMTQDETPVDPVLYLE